MFSIQTKISFSATKPQVYILEGTLNILIDTGQFWSVLN